MFSLLFLWSSSTVHCEMASCFSEVSLVVVVLTGVIVAIMVVDGELIL